MTHSVRLLMAVAAVMATLPAVVSGHFQLLEPTSWLIEDNRGDPQKGGPCGGSNTDWGTPSNVVNKAVGGQKLHVKVQETVYHPGHYRVALSVNSRNDLPLDPQATTRPSDRGPWSVSAAIQDSPVIPVLADGLFVHNMRPDGQAPPWEADVQLPNINCKTCTLQVVQFMEEHAFNNPGGYTYHHCANLAITALELTAEDHREIAAVLARRKGPAGDTFALERDRTGRHSSIMKYNLNKGAA